MNIVIAGAAIPTLMLSISDSRNGSLFHTSASVTLVPFSDRRTNYQWTDAEHYSHFTNKNTQLVAAYVTNTSGFYRNDRHQTTFIEVSKQDILNIWNDIPDEKGFKQNEVGSGLVGSYMNGTINSSGGRIWWTTCKFN